MGFLGEKGIFLHDLYSGKKNPSLKFLQTYLWMICLKTSPGDWLLCKGYKLNWRKRKQEQGSHISSSTKTCCNDGAFRASM